MEIPRLTFLQTQKIMFLGEDSSRYDRQRLPAFQAVQEHKAIDKLSEVSMALPLKWLTEKPIWVKQ